MNELSRRFALWSDVPKAAMSRVPGRGLSCRMVLLAFAFSLCGNAASGTFHGSVQPAKSARYVIVADSAGPVRYTLTWPGGGRLKACILVVGETDVCREGASPLIASHQITRPGEFSIEVSGGAASFDLTVTYPTRATAVFVGNEIRDDPGIPPNRWMFTHEDRPTAMFEVGGGNEAFVVFSIDGGKTYNRIGAEYVRNAGPNDLVKATLPPQPLNTAVAYRVGARAPNGIETLRVRDEVYFVSNLPVRLSDIPADPPFYRTSRPFPSPAHWAGQSFYMLMTDRFENGDPTNDRLGFTNFDLSRGDRMHGGDWAGITARLDYLKDLGITAIWINPVPQNFETYHGYGAANFLLPARQNGTLEELRALVDAAHRRGIYVVLDLVCNHQGRFILNVDNNKFNSAGHPMEWAYVAAPETGKPLTYPLEFRDKRIFHNFGYIDSSDDQGAAQSHAELGELRGLNDFKTEDLSPGGTADALIKIAKWWMANTDVDGFRLDAIKHIDLPFLRAFAVEVKRYARERLGKERFFLTGEFIATKDEKLFGYTGPPDKGLDSLLDFPTEYTLHAVFKQQQPTSQIGEHYAERLRCGPRHDEPCYFDPSLLMTFVDNHDQSRFLNDSSEPQLKAALGFLYTSPGIPVLYYGTEQGFKGHRDKGCSGGDCNREDMFANPAWDANTGHTASSFDNKSELYQFIRKLNTIRNSSAALRRGTMTERYKTDAGPGLYVFTRQYENEEVLIAVNSSSEPRAASVEVNAAIHPAGAKLVDKMGSGRAIVREGGKGISRVDLNVGAYGVQVFR
jgi:glycosidase